MTLMEKTIYWLPRALSIGFVLFLSSFALDVFSTYSGVNVIVPLLIHLIPSLVLLVAIFIAWKWEWVGAILFLGFAIFYVWSAGFGRPWSWYVAIALPSAIVGILFLIGWLQKQKRAQKPETITTEPD